MREPLLHFVLIGVGLGVLQHWVRPSTSVQADSPERTIRVSASDVERLEAEWRARWLRPPTPDELDGLIRGRVRETVLYREALAMGMDEGDPVVRRVLVQKLQTLASDLVELGLSSTEADLEEFYARHAERYRPESRVTFTQVFLDPDRRGDRTLEDAERLLAELRERRPGPEELEGYGDALLLQRHYPDKTEQRVAALFGKPFARSVFELEPGRWHGPVLSGYGTHLVRVDRLRELPLPELDEVRERVAQDWLDEQRRQITEQYFDELLGRYEVIVERRPAADPAEGKAP